MIKTEEVCYSHGTKNLVGFGAFDDSISGKRPGILLAHAWGGRDNFATEKAKYLAGLGYYALAIDMYGNGKTGSNNDENAALMNPFMEDRSLLKDRIFASLETIRSLDRVDNEKIGAIGFCFGGLCVLDLARSGVPVKGVVSFHGLLQAPLEGETKEITTKILALHGHNDPMATPDQVSQFTKEMTERKADWQIHIYGKTLHAFTNPEANDPGFGTVYSATADRRAFKSMENFFTEIF
jgi:dienelactone hydrolase